MAPIIVRCNECPPGEDGKPQVIFSEEAPVPGWERVADRSLKAVSEHREREHSADKN
jgi:hypothetical protein